jgi:hypothetical protein
MADENLAPAVCAAAARTLTKAAAQIRHCVDQLADEQVWWRPAPAMNSIGNLILHLCGNIRQWIVSGIGGAEDVRQRPAEFAERGPIARAELLQRLDSAVTEACAALSRCSGKELLRPRRIQGFDVTGIEAIFDSVPHFKGHTQEIVHLTRLQLGGAYRFAWVPTTPEQGASL